MEFLQAFLFTSKYLFGRNGNTDIFYLFSMIILMFYIWKRHEKLKLICGISIPVLVITIIMAFAYPWTVMTRCFVFFAKMLLNITLMVFVAWNCKKWKISRFVETVAIIHGIETLIALCFKNSALWASEQLLNNENSVMRLRLFYANPGAMAFASGLALVILVYLMMKEEIVWRYVLGIVIVTVDLFLSFGITGIACALVGIISMLGMTAINNLQEGKSKYFKKNAIYVLAIATVSAIALGLNSTYLGRIKEIIAGTDHLLLVKLIEPIENMGRILTETKFLGVGFGNGNTGFALDLIGASKAYPNSFIRIIVEGGIFGILFVVILIAAVGYYCFRYGKLIDKTLFIFITFYQMIGGYFTDPTNYFIYGWIIGESIYNKIDLTGKCTLTLFMPLNKDSLSIAQIGHKRIPSREGGVEIVVEEISTRLVKLGHNVDAYNRSGQHVSGKEFNLVDYDNLKEYEGIKIIKVNTIQKKGLAAFVYSFFASLRVIGKDYDIVHYHAEGPCLFMWIPSMFGIRTIATIHGLDWQRSGKWGSLGSTVIKLGEKIAAMFADEIIVLSRHVQKYFLETYNRKAVLIPNGANKPLIKEPVLINEKYGLGGQDYILTLSRLTREKKTDLLIEAFKEIKTDKKLIISGGSSDSDEYVNQLHELAKGDSRIIFTGFVQGQELEELFSNAYVYCLPSELEGMPLSLLEAMSYGNCCLVSDIPENTDVIRNKGVSFETNDKASLIEALQELIDEPDLVNRFRSKASNYICEKYNWDKIVDDTINLYYQRG